MGGSSKPADPKVTPYQEPAAPANPIPNWFTSGAGGGYVPDTGGSQSAFGQLQPADSGPAPQTFDQPSLGGPPQQQMMPFSIPTGMSAFQGMEQGIPQRPAMPQFSDDRRQEHMRRLALALRARAHGRP